MTYDKDSFLAGLSVGMSLRYSKRIPAPLNCLTFSSPSAFTISVSNAIKNWDGTLEYSTDARSWNLWDGTTTLTANNIVGTYKMFLRGIGNTIITGDGMSTGINRRWIIVGNDVMCYGDIRTLLNYTDVDSAVMADACFAYMFTDCASLVSAPTLPSDTLSDSCYLAMFRGCSSLVFAPELPATTLAQLCYSSMFLGCTSLTSAPTLPAIELATGCYISMFEGCTSLTSAPALPTTALATYCYTFMFADCVSLITIPSLPSTVLKGGCYTYMFRGCVGIKLSEIQNEEYQTPYRIPTIGTGTTAAAGLDNMFYGTGGSFAGTPTVNTTYYTSNTVIL